MALRRIFPLLSVIVIKYLLCTFVDKSGRQMAVRFLMNIVNEHSNRVSDEWKAYPAQVWGR